MSEEKKSAAALSAGQHYGSFSLHDPRKQAKKRLDTLCSKLYKILKEKEKDCSSTRNGEIAEINQEAVNILSRYPKDILIRARVNLISTRSQEILLAPHHRKEVESSLLPPPLRF